MKKRYWLNSDELKDSINESTADDIKRDLVEMNAMADRVPRGVEVEENRIYFYCPVGDYEALELNRLLRRLDVEMKYLANRLECRGVPIHLHVHSPGGSVFAGLSIADNIKSCSTDVYTYVDGSVASAATLISMSGKKRFMSRNSFMLLHQPQLEWAGKLDDFRDEVENQDHLYEKITNLYLDNSAMSKQELDDLLKRELWLPAEKCLELGIIDKII
jgi:ATP-dependent protease ClpP protease subunit